MDTDILVNNIVMKAIKLFMTDRINGVVCPTYKNIPLVFRCRQLLVKRFGSLQCNLAMCREFLVQCATPRKTQSMEYSGLFLPKDPMTAYWINNLKLLSAKKHIVKPLLSLSYLLLLLLCHLSAVSEKLSTSH